MTQVTKSVSKSRGSKKRKSAGIISLEEDIAVAKRRFSTEDKRAILVKFVWFDMSD